MSRNWTNLKHSYAFIQNEHFLPQPPLTEVSSCSPTFVRRGQPLDIAASEHTMFFYFIIITHNRAQKPNLGYGQTMSIFAFPFRALTFGRLRANPVSLWHFIMCILFWDVYCNLKCIKILPNEFAYATHGHSNTLLHFSGSYRLSLPNTIYAIDSELRNPFY